MSFPSRKKQARKEETHTIHSSVKGFISDLATSEAQQLHIHPEYCNCDVH